MPTLCGEGQGNLGGREAGGPHHGAGSGRGGFLARERPFGAARPAHSVAPLSAAHSRLPPRTPGHEGAAPSWTQGRARTRGPPLLKVASGRSRKRAAAPHSGSVAQEQLLHRDTDFGS